VKLFTEVNWTLKEFILLIMLVQSYYLLLFCTVFGMLSSASIIDIGCILCVCRSIDQYSAGPDSSDLNGIGILKSFGDFIVIFLGAFTLGSGMGCCTALVSLVVFFVDLTFYSLFIMV